MRSKPQRYRIRLIGGGRRFARTPFNEGSGERGFKFYDEMLGTALRVLSEH